MDLKILMVNDYLVKSGAEQVMRNLIEVLQSDGHDIQVVVRESNESDFTSVRAITMSSRIPTLVLSYQILPFFRFDPRSYSYFLKIIDRFRPDIIHCHNISSFGTAPLIAARKRGIPCVFTVHDYWAVASSRALLSRKGLLCLDRNSWRCAQDSCRILTALGRANALFSPFVKKTIDNRIKDFEGVDIVAVSDYTKSILQASFPNHKLHAILNGINTHEFSRMKVPRLSSRILFMGGSTWQKGIHHFREVAHVLSRKGMVPDCVVTGFVRRSWPSSEGLRYTGFLSRPSLKAYLASSTCLVIPSLWPEPCPLAAMEAMSLGVPVVAYDVGGIPEIITNGRDGYIVRGGDVEGMAERIGVLMTDQKAMAEMSESACLKANLLFNRELMASRYENLYEKLRS